MTTLRRFWLVLATLAMCIFAYSARLEGGKTPDNGQLAGTKKESEMKKRLIVVSLAGSIHEIRGLTWPLFKSQPSWHDMAVIEEPATVEVILTEPRKRWRFESSRTVLMQQGEKVCEITLAPMENNGTFEEAMTAIEELGRCCDLLASSEEYKTHVANWRKVRNFDRIASSSRPVPDLSLDICVRQPKSVDKIWVWFEIVALSLKYPTLYAPGGKPIP